MLIFTLNNDAFNMIFFNHEESILNYNTPLTKTERIVADIWHNCLGIDKIDINSDFFELGGHSLMAVKVMSLIEKQTGDRVPLASLIENPTIAKLAAYYG